MKNDKKSTINEELLFRMEQFKEAIMDQGKKSRIRK